MTTILNRCFMRLVKRAENQDPPTLVRTFVDVGPLMTLLSSRDHQILYGRRGTGKTHVLVYLGETAQLRGEVAVNVDMRTIGSNTSIYSDPELPLAQRGTRLILDFLNAIHDRLVTHALETDSPAPVLIALDQLADHISAVHISGPVEVERSSGSEVESGSNVGYHLKAGPSEVSASLDSGRTEKSKGSSTDRLKLSGEQRHRVSFGAVGSTLQRIVDGIPSKRLWVLSDEWSVIPLDLQPLVADLVRRTLFPVRGISVKIAAIEQRSRFRGDGAAGDYIGIELGADATADLDLDDFMVFGMDASKATAFFEQLLYKHIGAVVQEDPNLVPSKVEWSVPPPERFVAEAFTQANVFTELVRAAEGVPRDAINIAAIAAQKADDLPISMHHVRSAARTWYQRDKEATVPADAKQLLHWVIDEVIGNRRARAFLLKQGRDTGHPLVGQLVDCRVLHVLKKGVSAKDQPGVRFDVYSLDYGCYVDLLATKNAPAGLFQAEEEAEYVEVPGDDYRSIRRAILNLSEFEAGQKRERSEPSN